MCVNLVVWIQNDSYIYYIWISWPGIWIFIFYHIGLLLDFVKLLFFVNIKIPGHELQKRIILDSDYLTIYSYKTIMILNDISFNSSIYRIYEIVGYWHLVNKKRTIINHNHIFLQIQYTGLYVYVQFLWWRNIEKIKNWSLQWGLNQWMGRCAACSVGPQRLTKLWKICLKRCVCIGVVSDSAQMHIRFALECIRYVLGVY